ncbi:hypothetical protein V1511DRAFT_459670 [Dipodascopsis uninucleata]
MKHKIDTPEQDDEQDGDAYDEDDDLDRSLPSTESVFTVVRKNTNGHDNARKRKRSSEASKSIKSDLEDSNDYEVYPKDTWDKLERFRNFVVGDERFTVGDFVFVNHSNIVSENIILSDPTKYWIGRVLEIRASDASHVYIRLFWMYWPNELPNGRQYYHGKKELVASNHMDVIDAMTVAGKALVSHWLELDDDDRLNDLFWRQFYDSYTGELKPIRKHCKCQRFYNPDSTMIWCNNCSTWLHESCVIEDLQRTYKDDIKDDQNKKKSKRTSKRSNNELNASTSSIEIEAGDTTVAAHLTLKDGSRKEVPVVCLKCRKQIE